MGYSDHRTSRRRNDFWRYLIALLIPPLALVDMGWDKLAITAALWFVTGIGGHIAAFYFLLDGSAYDRWRHQNFNTTATRYDNGASYTKRKRDQREYIELADGDVLEVVDTADEERHQRLSQ